MSKLVDKIIVCTDSKKIYNVVKCYGFEVLMTKKKHKNGTERVAEIAKNLKAELVIDIQCDACFLDPEEISRLIKFHKKNKKFDIVIPHSEYRVKNDINAVKIISNLDNEIIYLSRKDVPLSFKKKINYFKRHQDFISFKPRSLQKFVKLKSSPLEQIEGIELLRAIENNFKLGTYKILDDSEVCSINTKLDLKKGKLRMKNDKFFKRYSKIVWKKIIMKKYLDYISFKRDVLLNFVKLKQSVLELLRATKNNFKVDTFKNKNDLFSFNTKKELNKVIQIIEFSRWSLKI